MTLFGLNIVDFSIVLLYVVVILWLGRRAGRGTKDTSDFFLAGRKLGKFYQFFLNFGQSTDAGQAVGVSREIYRQGLGGMWIQYLVLFLTPFYWFTTLWFRRSRLVTIGDFFTERFRSPFLGGAYAVFGLVMAFIGCGTSYMMAQKTMAAMTPKQIEDCSAAERASMEQFREYIELKEKLDKGLTPHDRSWLEKLETIVAEGRATTEQTRKYEKLSSRRERGLSETEQARFDELDERMKRGELHSFFSYTDKTVFFIAFAILVAAYTALGGFTAAALTDAIQGVLIIVFSFILIPIGLREVGGFEGLHGTVPDYKFLLFGSAATSEYAWYTIAAMITANLVSIVAASHMMATAGSATNEMTARVGMLGGMFFKRFIMLFWALAGLLAIALYSGELHDPDLIWGHMTSELLFTGAIGLMLAGILAANMSSLDAQSVCNSALFIRNLYQPLYPGRSERHYINVGRVLIVLILLGGIVAAHMEDNLLNLFKYFISLPAVFGAAVWLGFMWRRLTRTAVIVQVVICFSIYALIPNIFPALDAIRLNEAFLKETVTQEQTVTTGALTEDVEAGFADHVGQSIEELHVIRPTGIFFEKVVRENPGDPDSPRRGEGRFQAEIWVLSWFGIDFSLWTKAQLEAARFFFDALFPFVLLFGLSFFTRPAARRDLDRFFAKIHTPVQPDPEAERRAIDHAARHPELSEKKKLFPRSNWEIAAPGKIDLLGFGGSWVLVAVVVFLLWLLARLGT